MSCLNPTVKSARATSATKTGCSSPGLTERTSATVKLMPAKHRRYVHVRRVDECSTLDELFTHCLPAFGGAYLRRIYRILDHAIGMGCPLTLAVSGPVTV